MGHDFNESLGSWEVRRQNISSGTGHTYNTTNRGIDWNLDNNWEADVHVHWFDFANNQQFQYEAWANDTYGNIGSAEIELTKYSYTPFNLIEVLGGPMGLILAAAVSGTMIPVTVGISKTRYYKSLNKKDRKKIRRIMLLVYTCLTFILLTFVI